MLKQLLRGFKRKGCINHELLAGFRLRERVRFPFIVLRFRQSLFDDVDEDFLDNLKISDDLSFSACDESPQDFEVYIVGKQMDVSVTKSGIGTCRMKAK